MAEFTAARIVLAVAKHGSISAAAQTLGLDYSTVRRQLRGIETRLGVTFFEGHAGGQRPTRAGRIYITALQNAEALLNDAERQIHGQDASLSGQLSIATTEAFFCRYLIGKLDAFGDLYPDVLLNFRFGNAFHDLTNRDADLAIRFANDPGDHLVGRRICSMGFAHYQRADVSGNGAQSWVGWSPSARAPDWIKQSPFPDAPIGYTVESELGQLEMVSQGMGMGWFACYLGDTHPNLQRIPGSTPVDMRDLWVLIHRDLQSSPRVRVFLDYIIPVLRKDAPLFSGKRNV